MVSDESPDQGAARRIDSADRVRDPEVSTALNPEDDENLRLVNDFSDVFLTFAIALFVGVLGLVLGGIFGDGTMCLILAVASWWLAEFFTRQQRMALPSIFLLTCFTVSVFGLANFFLKWLRLSEMDYYFKYSGLLDGWGYDSLHPWITVVAALFTVFMTTLHYRHFRVPMTIAVRAAASVVAFLGLLLSIFPNPNDPVILLSLFASGCAVFAMAMRFDFSDPQRVTRRNDIAFWLHLLAAPLIVHPLISQFVGNDLLPQVWAAAAVLALFVLLSIVAVVIDRRAMLVSGLVYAGYALSSLISTIGLADRTLPATVLALGAFVLLLSAGWRPVRTALLRLLPAHLAQRLPHPILSSS